MKYAIKIVIVISILTSGCSLFYLSMRYEGSSMLPEYKNGDRIYVNRLIGGFNRGDVIAHEFPLDRSKLYVKRIVALPGESVSIVNGTVYINGKPIKESYVDQANNQHKLDFKPMAVPPDCYFVLGDNRDNSSDSRIWGTVKKEMVIGKVVGKD